MKISQMTWKYVSFSQTAGKSPLNIRFLSPFTKCSVCGVSPSPRGLPRQAFLLLLSFIRRQSRMGEGHCCQRFGTRTIIKQKSPVGKERRIIRHIPRILRALF
ncbi:hypothetical protein CDAR_595831 [Caerostris darwini]|uniref:Uncharacterized protein n=1 Tax=Caerostris darwini TaxID=1538125 RepID=A0AAV4Q3W3_9ARAC|nr:hypothetical protein CDAR_595831 [Caerostris darwini]